MRTFTCCMTLSKLRFTLRPAQAIVAGVSVVVLAVSTAVLTATMASLAAAVPPVAAPALSVNTTGFPSGGANPGIFTDTCMLSTTKPNDPIMMPRMTGSSMQHDFFGNPAVTASSTAKQLVGGSSTCSTTADASAYWTPVFYQNGTALTPKSTLIYWRAPAASASAVKTMPAGISMIAGDEAAGSPQNPKIIDWTCTTARDAIIPARGNTPRDCPAGSDVRLVVTFPNCWDGHSLDGKSQQNVVYTDADGACPTSHPVQIPQIVMHIAYPTSSANGLTLSIGPTQQGPTVTGHADFMSGWTQSRMDADVAACIDTQTRCGRTSGADATPAGGVATR